jgi:hypothetical protein
LPADTVTTPRSRASAAYSVIAFSAPRTLNDPVFCSASHFSDRDPRRASPARIRELSMGVTWSRGMIRARAALMMARDGIGMGR